MRCPEPFPRRLTSLALLALLTTTAPIAGQGETAKQDDVRREITLELIMSHPDWLGNAPESPYWADDGGSVYYSRKRPGEEERDLLHVDLDGDLLAVVGDAERGDADFDGGEWSRDRQRKVYSRQGDLFLKDVAGGEIRQLTRTAAAESRPRFLLDGRVAFERGDAVLIRDLESGLELQAADLRLAEEPAEENPKGYLAEQQPRLIDWVREQQEKKKKRRERDREAQAADPTRLALPFYLGDGVEIFSQQLAATGDWMLLALREKDRQRGRRDKMSNYISDDGYVSLSDVRPKVGTGKPSGVSFSILDLERHVRHELDLADLPGITEDPLADLRRQAEERRQRREEKAGEETEDTEEGQEADTVDAEEEAGESKGDAEEKPRPVFPLGFEWSADGRHVAMQLRSLDNKDRWIVLVGRDEEGQPELRVIHHLFDEAWINWSHNDFGWLAGSRHLYFLSEESGYSQLYLYDLEDGNTRRLTEGEHVVEAPEPSANGRYLYYTANPQHPGLCETFRVETNSGSIEQLTQLGGRNRSQLSPDGKRLLVTHSRTTAPPELYLQETRPGAAALRLTWTTSDAFASQPWVEPQIVEVASSHHDRPIYSRFYPSESPRTRGAGGKRGAVVFVHGAGYLQNAHQGWSSYFRELMFHTFLARHGYVVLDMDYRASQGYGRDWRTAIYRQMGTPELEDLEDGVAWLVKNHDVDPERVGVYGGSYGGFMTFMALFKRPELFACGAALRPVTDWAHYNSGYTSNILNTPEIDPEAYERSSPIELAEGLEKPLLMCSGMQDGNVLFQDTVRLVQRLIELGKEDWELAIYPVEPHSFREPSSWLDEYRRIFKLFETHLLP